MTFLAQPTINSKLAISEWCFVNPSDVSGQRAGQSSTTALIAFGVATAHLQAVFSKKLEKCRTALVIWNDFFYFL